MSIKEKTRKELEEFISKCSEEDLKVYWENMQMGPIASLVRKAFLTAYYLGFMKAIGQFDQSVFTTWTDYSDGGD